MNNDKLILLGCGIFAFMLLCFAVIFFLDGDADPFDGD